MTDEPPRRTLPTLRPPAHAPGEPEEPTTVVDVDEDLTRDGMPRAPLPSTLPPPPVVRQGGDDIHVGAYRDEDLDAHPGPGVNCACPICCPEKYERYDVVDAADVPTTVDLERELRLVRLEARGRAAQHRVLWGRVRAVGLVLAAVAVGLVLVAAVFRLARLVLLGN